MESARTVFAYPGREREFLRRELYVEDGDETHPEKAGTLGEEEENVYYLLKMYLTNIMIYSGYVFCTWIWVL